MSFFRELRIYKSEDTSNQTLSFTRCHSIPLFLCSWVCLCLCFRTFFNCDFNSSCIIISYFVIVMLSPTLYPCHIYLSLFLCHSGKGSCDLTEACVAKRLLTLQCIFDFFFRFFHTFVNFITRLFSFNVIYEHSNLHLRMYREDLSLSRALSIYKKCESYVAHRFCDMCAKYVCDCTQFFFNH